MSKVRTFTLQLVGDVSAGRLEDALYVGLERNEEEWKTFSIKEVGEDEKNDQ
ncbi:hypothetical protein [Bacillus cereus]|uniref:Uncharacterized protein n=1 Tax=Bacillus cereus TIAC219 TaxID=718222 RepID=A0ABC9SQK9_BACCE|nr:hypothetical protein [Bacillus cereus]EJP81114.1 hypothetical protein IC1_06602 [Bacillus cereus VD022]EOQ57857.1 hypothetical protein IAY_06229 [Bacillus cereus TIAC219]